MESSKARDMMEYNFLGRSGLCVSSICLGGMTFGKDTRKGVLGSFGSNPRQLDESLSHQILDRFAEVGGNFIDTANIYSFGKSEEIIGRWLETQRRQDFVISTKVGIDFEEGNRNETGLSRRHITQSLDGSMARLKTNYVDLYYTHRWDNGTPLEETMRTLNDLVRIGKVHYIGCSNVTGWQLQKIADYSTSMGLSKVVALQQQYNLLSRHWENEGFPVCQNEGIAVVPWSPLMFGLLTGKFTRKDDPTPDVSRLGHFKGLGIIDYWNLHKDCETYWKLVDVLKSLASKYGKPVPSISLRWLLQKRIGPSIVIGVTSVEQLEENMDAAKDWKLSDEDMEKLDRLTSPDKHYPFDLLELLNGGRQNPYC